MNNNYLYYNADKRGQAKVIPVLQQIFSGCTLTIEPHYEDGSPIDIYMTAVTLSNKVITYAMECKDREYKHNTKFFLEEGYILEKKKEQRLKDASAKGYKPIYINTFADDVIIVWNLNKIDFSQCGETGNKQWHKATVIHQDGDLYEENKKTVRYEQKQWMGKIK